MLVLFASHLRQPKQVLPRRRLFLPSIAIKHAMGSGARHPLLLRFMDPGCDISFLSSAQSSLRRLWFSSTLTLLSAWCAPLEQFSLTNRSLSTHREPI